MKRKVADRKLDWINDSEARGSTASQEKWGKKPYLSTDLTSRILLIKHQMVWKKWHSFLFHPKSSKGFGRDARGEGAGLQTAGMQGFVLWLFRSAFLKLCGWRSQFSTRLQDIEAVTLPLFWPETHPCGDGQPREWMRKQGGSIWLLPVRAEFPWSTILIHANAHMYTHTRAWCCCRGTFPVDIPHPGFEKKYETLTWNMSKMHTGWYFNLYIFVVFQIYIFR